MPPHEYTRLRMLMTSCIWYISSILLLDKVYKVCLATITPLLQPYSRSSADRMLKVFILACCLAVTSYGDPNAQFGGYPVSYPYSFHQLKPNHHQIIPSINNIDSSEVNERAFWANYYNYYGRPTITVYTVSTFTFTCTKSTSSTCAGRRRREVLDGLLSSTDQTQQFPEITPSKVAA